MVIERRRLCRTSESLYLLCRLGNHIANWSRILYGSFTFLYVCVEPTNPPLPQHEEFV